MKDKEHVWEFTNKRKLNKKEFVGYFERKIFRTIRKYRMLPKKLEIVLKKSLGLNTAVLKKVLEKKFVVKFGSKPNLSSDNLSFVAEDFFKNVLCGEFSGVRPKNQPLYFLSDREIELYAKLMGIKGEKRKKNPRIQSLFEKFIKKNPDLEINIVNGLSQLDS